MAGVRCPDRGLPREAGAVVDAAGKAVCPGFVSILSHSHLSILHDPRSLGELTQGVRTEVFGEGTSMGPLTPRLKAELKRAGRGLDVEVRWTRLSEYLRHVDWKTPGTSSLTAPGNRPPILAPGCDWRGWSTTGERP